MTDHSDSERRYSEKQIGRLIQRATELHEADETSPDHSLSLKDVQQIASDLGVSPEHVEDAAREMDMDDILSNKTGLFGGPFREQYSHIVSGELTDAQWEEILLELRRIAGGSGKTKQIGQIREWSKVLQEGDATLQGMRITLRPNEGKTTIDLERHFGFFAFNAFLASGVAGFFLSGLTLSTFGFPPLLNVISGILGGLLGMSTTRALFSMWRQKQQKRLRAYAKVIASKIKPGKSTSNVADSELTQHSSSAVPTTDLLGGVDDSEPSDIEISSSRTRQKT